MPHKDTKPLLIVTQACKSSTSPGLGRPVEFLDTDLITLRVSFLPGSNRQRVSPSGNLRFLVSFATSSRAYSPNPRTSGSVIADLVAGTTMFTSSRWECNPQQQLRQRLRSMIWSEPSFCSGGPKPGLAFARCFVKP